MSEIYNREFLTMDELDKIIKPFRVGEYLEINKARLDHLETLGLELKGKTVLDVGCGPGDLTGFFIDKGALVTVTDARKELVDYTIGRFNCKGFVCDASEGIRGYFDIVFAYGILYHLRDPMKFLDCLNCKTLLISTIVCNEGLFNQRDEDITDTTQTFDGFGCWPNRDFLKRYLESLAYTVTIPKKKPKHYQFNPMPEDAKVNDGRLFREIYICKR